MPTEQDPELRQKYAEQAQPLRQQLRSSFSNINSLKDLNAFNEQFRITGSTLGSLGGQYAAEAGIIPTTFNPQSWAGYGMQQWQDLTEEQQATLQAQQETTIGRFGGYLENMAQQLGITSPYMQQAQMGGLAAMGEGLAGYQSLLADPSSVLQDPGVMAQMRAGQQAVESSAAAGGMQLSGATLASLQQRGQDIGRQAIDAALARQQGLADLGMQQFGDISDVMQGAQELGLRGQAGLAGLEHGFMQQGMDIGSRGLENIMDIYGAATQGITGADLARQQAEREDRQAKQKRNQEMFTSFMGAFAGGGRE